MKERSRSTRVLSTTAQRLARVTSIAQARELLRECMTALFGEHVESELIVEGADVSPASSRGLAVPLSGISGNVGIIVLHGVDHEESTIEVVKGIAAQFAMVVERLRPAANAHSVSRMRAQLQSGREMQLLVLPGHVEDAAFQVSSFYEPYFEVGGDFYEVVTGDPGKLTILVADASGKGVGAALLMMRLVGEFRVLAQHTDDPAEILEALNRSLTRSPAGDGFVTALCASLSRFKSSISIANAGHVLPLLRRRDGISTVCEPSPPLGMLAEPRYVSERHLFEEGDLLLMMTDGFSEPFELEGAPGPKAIYDAIRRAHDEQSACDLLRAAWMGALAAAKRKAFDDATLVVVRHSGMG